MVVALKESTPDSALAVLERLLSDPENFGPQFEKIQLGDWAKVHVYLPEPELHSAITPPFMEAFLELQKQIYRLGALAESGVADIGQLSDGAKRTLEIKVVVTDGSSNLSAQLTDVVDGLLKKMIGKMTGKQAAIVILGIAVLIAGSWSFAAWLDATKAIKIEEIKSKEHVTALESLKFANEKDAEAFQKILVILEKQGEMAKRAIEAVQATNEAFLKAAAQTQRAKINEVEITRTEAELLRVAPRKKPETKVVRQRMKVVAINTDDPFDLSIILKEPDTGDEYRIRFKDDLFAGPNRDKLFESLKTREPIWVELSLKQVEGDIRSVQLLRTLEAHDITGGIQTAE